MDPQVPEQEFEAIERMIQDPGSPVGIDAKKTHVIIIHILMDLQRRVKQLERLHGNGLG